MGRGDIVNYELRIAKLMLTQIYNGTILTPQGWLKDGSVIFEDGKIIEVTGCDLPILGAERYDALGMYIVPGFIDIHIHGGGGRDFQEGTETAFRAIAEAHAPYGTTSMYATLSSSPWPMMLQAIDTCDSMIKDPSSPILGLHLEGPYLNPARAGAQMHDVLKIPDLREYGPLIKQSTSLRRWDAAPEMPGAIEFGRYCSEHGILPCIGHTNAEYQHVLEAYKVGYTHVTHFYNAMPGFHNKQGYKYEGTVESVYLMDDMTIECIADGIHVPPTILRMAYKIKGVERMCAITDALAVSALEPGTDAKAFDPRVIVEDGVCKLSDHTALAGSIATTDRLVRTLVNKADIPLYDAIRMVSEIPARIMKDDHRKGTLQRGKDADIVLLDTSLHVRSVWQMGKLTVENDRASE